MLSPLKTEVLPLENRREDMQAMKEIYDEIFYLHDMYEKPDISTMLKKDHEDPAKVKMPNMRGRYLSEFEEIELIGEGGFGKVYKVRHKLDGNIYAIKKAVVNYEDLNDRKILKEVSLLSKLNHPNIVRYYQSWLEDSNSMAEILEDMDFGDDEEKIEELNYIFKQWKHDRSGGIMFEEGS
jgi:serine/threonine protein kinase